MPKIKVFEWADYEQQVLSQLDLKIEADFTSARFDLSQALNYQVICIFVDSQISADDLRKLKDAGLERVVIRAAGCNMVDVETANDLGIEVCRVAAYSPESIAEHAFALLLALSRKLTKEREHHQVLKNDRTNDLLGTTLAGKKLGLYGVGKIGSLVAKIAAGFNMQVLFFDKFVEFLPEAQKVNSLNELFAACDVVSVHVPLTPETRHSVNSEVLAVSKSGLTLINTSRGDVVDPEAVIAALDKGQLGALGVDVWDSGDIDDKFDERLLRYNVIQTEHIGFFTREAVSELLRQTVDNINGVGKEENKVVSCV